MSHLTDQANEAAASPEPVADSVFALRHAILALPEYTEDNPSGDRTKNAQYIDFEYRKKSFGIFDWIKDLREYARHYSKQKVHSVVSTDPDQIAHALSSENFDSSYPTEGAKEALADDLKRAGLFNENTGEYEFSIARIDMIEKRQKLAAAIPLDLEENPTISELADYIERAEDILERLAKSIDLTISGEQCPPSSVEVELGLSGEEENDFDSYYSKAHKAIYADKEMDWQERDKQIAELRALREKHGSEISKYLFMKLAKHGEEEPELGVDPVFDAMFQTVIDAYEETAQKVAQARDDLISKLEAIQDAPRLQPVINSSQPEGHEPD